MFNIVKRRDFMRRMIAEQGKKHSHVRREIPSGSLRRRDGAAISSERYAHR